MKKMRLSLEWEALGGYAIFGGTRSAAAGSMGDLERASPEELLEKMEVMKVYFLDNSFNSDRL